MTTTKPRIQWKRPAKVPYTPLMQKLFWERGGIARSKVLVVTRDSGRLGRSTKFYALLVQIRGR